MTGTYYDVTFEVEVRASFLTTRRATLVFKRVWVMTSGEEAVAMIVRELPPTWYVLKFTFGVST